MSTAKIIRIAKEILLYYGLIVEENKVSMLELVLEMDDEVLDTDVIAPASED